MKRDEAIKIIMDNLNEEDFALFTTGMISREAFAIKDRKTNFYMMGSMGLLSAVGLGISLCSPLKKVIVVEGDGSVLMSLGNLPMIGVCSPANFIHLVLDNESYESTGNQPTITKEIDLSKSVQTFGYKNISKVDNIQDFTQKFKEFLKAEGPNFILVKVESSRLKGVPRISFSPEELTERFVSIQGE
ncbi:MAG: thiamine pyrophosphate-dependent enzyme [bacterium]